MVILRFGTSVRSAPSSTAAGSSARLAVVATLRWGTADSKNSRSTTNRSSAASASRAGSMRFRPRAVSVAPVRPRLKSRPPTRLSSRAID